MKKLIFLIGIFIAANICISSAVNRNTDLKFKFKRKDRTDGKPYENQLSIVLVFDTTVSQSDYNSLRDTCFKILDKLDEENYSDLIYNYILVPFGDPFDYKIIKSRYKNSIKNDINNINLKRNNDCPEPVLRSLLHGLQPALPNSMVFVFTDASAKDANLIDGILLLIKRRNFTVNFFVTSYCNNKLEEYDVYNRIAKSGGGKLFDLNPDHVSTVLDFVKTTLDKSSTLLDYFSSAYKGNFSIPLIVDKTITNISISITGDDIAFTVIEPNGFFFEDYLEHVHLPTVRAIILKKPTVGKWFIVYQSSIPSSVKISNYGLLSFKYGFSQNYTNNVADTKFTPHNGKNILNIFPSNSSLLKSLVDVELVLYKELFDVEDEVVFFKLPLLQTNTDKTVYRTERFSPPNTLFKIYVNGFDYIGNSIRRLLSSQITPKNPINEDSLPEISIEMKHNDSLEDLQITCRVISLVPINIQWLKDDVFFKETDSDHSAELNLGVTEIYQNDSTPDVLKCFSRSMNGEVFLTVNTTDIIRTINGRNLTLKYKKIIVNEGSKIDDTLHTNKTIQATEKPLVQDPYEDNKSTTPTTTTIQPTIKYLRKNSSELIEVLVGTPLNISCESSDNPPSMTNWLYNNKDFNSFNKHSLGLSHIIYFERIKIEDKGNYTCIDKDIFGVIRKSYIVDVLYPPRVIDGNNSVEIRKSIGNDFEINCPIISNPKPVYQWTKHIPDTGEDIVLNSTESLLQIHNIQDSITYKCSAKNKYGASYVIFHVIVKKPPVLSKDEILKTNYGRNITMDCTLHSNNEEYNIFWLHNNDYIYYNNITIKNNTVIIDNGQKMIIFNLTESDNGEYICYVLYGTNNVQKRFQLSVSPEAVWTPWTQWTTCSSTCGQGQRTRARSCLFLNGTFADNSFCSTGDFLESKNCTNLPCVNQSVWTEWSSWSECSKSCYDEITKERSYKQRYRRCNVDDKKLCFYSIFDYEVTECNVDLCPINGGWSNWHTNKCSVTCGKGIQKRTRDCNKPSRKNGGLECQGLNTEYIACYLSPCNPIRGCRSGFRLNKIANSCDDINECLGYPCAYNEFCLNTFGSYNCYLKKDSNKHLWAYLV